MILAIDVDVESRGAIIATDADRLILQSLFRSTGRASSVHDCARDLKIMLARFGC